MVMYGWVYGWVAHNFGWRTNGNLVSVESFICIICVHVCACVGDCMIQPVSTATSGRRTGVSLHSDGSLALTELARLWFQLCLHSTFVLCLQACSSSLV